MTTHPLALAAAITATVVAPAHHPAHHRHPHHHTALWQWKLAPGFNTTATAYCYGSSTLMANGGHTHWGVVANNNYPLGTRFAFRPPIRNPATGEIRYIFTNSDRIGSGSEMDVWLPGVSEPDCGGTFPRGERVNVVLGRR